MVLKEGRFEDNYRNRAIFKMKIKALKVMDLFLNFRFYLRLQVRECFNVMHSSFVISL